MASTKIPLELTAYAPDADGATLELQTTDTTVTDGSVLGKIEFKAPKEASGTDAILTAAAIEAVAEGTFAADRNATELVFKTGESEAATQKMVITSGGSVGIGTASPSAQVHISNSGQAILRVEGVNQYYTGLMVRNNYSSTQSQWHIAAAGGSSGWGSANGNFIIRDDTTNSTAIEAEIGAGGSPLAALHIDSNSNVGIGTSSPDSDARLHAKGTTAHTYITVEANAGVTAASKYISGSNAWRVGIDTTCGADGDLVFANTESGTPIYGKFESDGDFQIHTSDSGIGRMGHIKTKYVTLADDALISLGSATTCGAWQVHVYERGSGAGAIFHCDYDGTTILVNQFVAGGAGFANSNADGYYGLYKGDNSHTVYFQNRNGASRTFHIMVYGAEV